MTEQEIDAANARGNADPTLKAVIDFVKDMGSINVGEASGFWVARECDDMRALAVATFVVAMEKAAVPTEG